MMAFKVGDKVKWTSQAGGNTRDKVGTVVLVVPSGVSYQDALRKAGISYKTHNMSAIGGAGYPRAEESYMVAVNTSKTGKGRPKIYWPRTASLRMAV